MRSSSLVLRALAASSVNILRVSAQSWTPAPACGAGGSYTDKFGAVWTVTCGSDSSGAVTTTGGTSEGIYGCFKGCDSRPLCTGFSFSGTVTGATSGSGTCSYKTSVGTLSSSTSVYAVAVLTSNGTPQLPCPSANQGNFTDSSGQVWSTFCGYDSGAGGASTAQGYVSTMPECMTQCNAIGNCKAFSFTYAGDEPADGSVTKRGTCYFKTASGALTGGGTANVNVAWKYVPQICNGAPSPASLASFDCSANSGQGLVGTYTDPCGVAYSVYCGRDSLPGAATNLVAQNVMECMQKCDTYNGCVAATYTQGNCYIKTSVTSISTSSNGLLAFFQRSSPGSGSGSSGSTGTGTGTGTGSGSASVSQPPAGATYSSTPSPAAVWKPTGSCAAGSTTGTGGAYTDKYNAVWNVVCSADTNNAINYDTSGTSGQGFYGCAKGCDSRPGCKSFAFIATSGYTQSEFAGYGNCYYKTAVGSYYVNSTIYAAADLISGSPSQPCPAYNGVNFTTSAGVYQISCNADSSTGSSSQSTVKTMADCVAACDTTTGCTGVSWTYPANTAEPKDADAGIGKCNFRTVAPATPGATRDTHFALRLSGSTGGAVSGSGSTGTGTGSGSGTGTGTSAAASSSSAAAACTGTPNPADLPTFNCGGTNAGRGLIGVYKDSCGFNYTIYCGSDTSPGSVANLGSTSVADCMRLCDSYSSGTCYAATYAGGSGAGTCYIKTAYTGITTSGTTTLAALVRQVPPNPNYAAPASAPGVNTSTGCGGAIAWGLTPNGASKSINFSSPTDGLQRNARVYLPQYYDPNKASPLIFGFHGNGNNAVGNENQMGLSSPKWNPYAIMIYVNGVGQGFMSNPAYKPGGTYGYVDDIGFVNYLINNMTSTFCVDTGRIFATGNSNGGGMCGVIACDSNLSQRFAAIAPNCGAFYSNYASNDPAGDPNTMDPVNTPVQATCNIRKGLPILETHGTNDGQIDYTGSRTHASLVLPSIPHWVTNRAQLQGFSANNYTTTPGNLITLYQFGGDVGQLGIVSHYRLTNWIHDWPSVSSGAPMDLSPKIMDFFYYWTNPQRQAVYTPSSSTSSSSSSSMSSTLSSSSTLSTSSSVSTSSSSSLSTSSSSSTLSSLSSSATSSFTTSSSSSSSASSSLSLSSSALASTSTASTSSSSSIDTSTSSSTSATATPSSPTEIECPRDAGTFYTDQYLNQYTILCNRNLYDPAPEDRTIATGLADCIEQCDFDQNGQCAGVAWIPVGQDRPWCYYKPANSTIIQQPQGAIVYSAKLTSLVNGTLSSSSSSSSMQSTSSSSSSASASTATLSTTSDTSVSSSSISTSSASSSSTSSSAASSTFVSTSSESSSSVSSSSISSSSISSSSASESSISTSSASSSTETSSPTSSSTASSSSVSSSSVSSSSASGSSVSSSSASGSSVSTSSASSSSVSSSTETSSPTSSSTASSSTVSSDSASSSSASDSSVSTSSATTSSASSSSPLTTSAPSASTTSSSATESSVSSSSASDSSVSSSTATSSTVSSTASTSISTGSTSVPTSSLSSSYSSSLSETGSASSSSKTDNSSAFSTSSSSSAVAPPPYNRPTTTSSSSSTSVSSSLVTSSSLSSTTASDSTSSASSPSGASSSVSSSSAVVPPPYNGPTTTSSSSSSISSSSVTPSTTGSASFSTDSTSFTSASTSSPSSSSVASTSSSSTGSPVLPPPYNGPTTTSSSSSSSASTSSAISTVSSSSSSSTVSSPTVSPTASAYTCPDANGKTVIDPYGVAYVIGCSQDTVADAYTNRPGVQSWADCFGWCNNITAQGGAGGCTSFTYTGTNNDGVGPGTCYLKPAVSDTFTPGAPSFVAAIRADVYNAQPLSSSTTSTSRATQSPAPSFCPGSNGTQYTDAGGVKYNIYCDLDSEPPSFGQSYEASFTDCLAACERQTTQTCGAAAYNSGICYYKPYPTIFVSTTGVQLAVVAQQLAGATTTSTRLSSSSTAISTSSTISASVLSTASSSRSSSVLASSTSITVNLPPPYAGSTTSSIPSSISSSISSSSRTSSAQSVSSSSSQTSPGVPPALVTTSTSTTSRTSSSSASSIVQPQTPIVITTTSSSTSSRGSSTSATTVVLSFSSSFSSTTSPSPSPVPNNDPPACPGSNSTTYTDNTGVAYTIFCGLDSDPPSYNNAFVTSFGACITLCDQDPQCGAVGYNGDNVNGGYCYLKRAATRYVNSPGIQLAVLGTPGGSSTSATVSSTSSLRVSSTSSQASSSSIVAPPPYNSPSASSVAPVVTSTTTTTTRTTTSSSSMTSSLSAGAPPPYISPSTTSVAPVQTTTTTSRTTTTSSLSSSQLSASSVGAPSPYSSPSATSTTLVQTTTTINSISSTQASSSSVGAPPPYNSPSTNQVVPNPTTTYTSSSAGSQQFSSTYSPPVSPVSTSVVVPLPTTVTTTPSSSLVISPVFSSTPSPISSSLPSSSAVSSVQTSAKSVGSISSLVIPPPYNSPTPSSTPLVGPSSSSQALSSAGLSFSSTGSTSGLASSSVIVPVQAPTSSSARFSTTVSVYVLSSPSVALSQVASSSSVVVPPPPPYSSPVGLTTSSYPFYIGISSSSSAQFVTPIPACGGATSGAATASAVNGSSCADPYGNTYKITYSSTQLVGKVSKKATTTTVNDCLILCDTTPGCKGANYIGSDCTLFEEVTGTTTIEGTIPVVAATRPPEVTVVFSTPPPTTTTTTTTATTTTTTDTNSPTLPPVYGLSSSSGVSPGSSPAITTPSMTGQITSNSAASVPPGSSSVVAPPPYGSPSASQPASSLAGVSSRSSSVPAPASGSASVSSSNVVNPPPYSTPSANVPASQSPGTSPGVSTTAPLPSYGATSLTSASPGGAGTSSGVATSSQAGAGSSASISVVISSGSWSTSYGSMSPPGSLSAYSVSSPAILSSAPSVSASVPTSSPSSTLPVLCPAYNGKNYTDSTGTSYTVTCNTVYRGAVYKRFATPQSLQSCLATCDQYDACIGVSNDDTGCTLYSSLVGTTPSSGGSAALKVSQSLCPAYNGQKYTASNGASYTVNCNTTYQGTAYQSYTTPQSLSSCLAKCDQFVACVAVSNTDTGCTLFSNANGSTSPSPGGSVAYKVSGPSSNVVTVTVCAARSTTTVFTTATLTTCAANTVCTAAARYPNGYIGSGYS